jgi:MFS family permease
VFDGVPTVDENRAPAARRPIDLSVLRMAPVRRLLAAQWTSLSGDWAMIAALPFVVYSLGGGPRALALGFAASAVSMVCLVLLGGVLADRHGRRRTLLFAETTRMVTQAALAASLLLGTARPWQVIAAMAALGAGEALAQPALSGLTAEVVPAGRLQAANALRGMLASVAVLSGPLLAGLALLLGGPGAAVALDAASYGLSALLLRGLRPLGGVWLRGAGGSLLADLRAGWAEFSARTWLWVMVCEFALFNMLVFGPFEVLGSQIAHRSLGGAGTWSAILAAFGLGQIAGAMLALAWPARRPLLAVALLLLGWVPLLVLLAAAAPLATIIIAAALAGAGWLLLDAIWEATLQGHVPGAHLSRVSSYDWLGATALMPFGFLLAVPVGSALGTGTALLLSALVVVLLSSAALATPAVRRMSRPAAGSTQGRDPVPARATAA